MPPFRLPPLLLLSAAALAGVAGGLRFGAAGAEGAAAVAGAAALLVLLAPRAGRRPASSRREAPSVAPCLLAAALAGAALGAHAARGARSACETSLRSGDPVEAVGRLRSSLLPGAGAGRAGRITLLEASLLREGRRCRVGSVVAYLASTAEAGAVAGAVREETEGRERVVAGAGGEAWGSGPPPRPGAAIRLRGEWRRVAPPGAWPPRPGSGILVGARPVASPARETVPAFGPLETARGRAAERLASRLPADVTPLALGLTVADRDALHPALARRFADAGLAHLLAISGLHVGILAGGLLWGLGLVLPRRIRYPAAVSACAAYVAAIGAPPAAVRALLLFGGLAAARTRGSPIRAGDLLGTAACLVVVLDPAAILGPGFQLSFAGFAGLAMGGAVAGRVVSPAASRRGPTGAGRGPPAVRRVAVAVAAGCGALACTAPIAAAHFGRAAPIAVLTNFVGVPLVAAALAGLAGVLALPAGPASILAATVTVILRTLVRLVEAVASLPIGHGAAPAPGPAGWGVAVLLLLAAWRFVGARRPAMALLPLGAACGLWLASPVLPDLLPARSALLCALDVGQGDAAVLRTRGGRWIAFDAGPPGARRGGSADFLAHRGARRIELLVLSHPHLDHLGGAETLLERFDVRGVLDAGNPVPEAGYDRFLAAVEEEGARWLPARAGARLGLDGARLTILGPVRLRKPDGEAGGAADANEASVSVRLEVDGFSYVNTGDAPVEAERELLERWPPATLRADVLKLGHHGSRTSSSLAWLRATSPAMAVISAGRRNRYGHPHPITLARLDSAGVSRVWRTDRDGTLCVEIGRGGEWMVRGG